MNSLPIYAFSLKICDIDIIYNLATFASTVIVKELEILLVLGVAFTKENLVFSSLPVT